MTSDRDLDTKIHAWLDEQPPGPPDRNAVYARVVDRLPATHQRRHWWRIQWSPFASGTTRSADAGGPRPQGRSIAMFNATRVVAIIAVAALGGTIALMTGPLQPAGQPIAPGAALGPEEITYVTGTATYLGEVEPCTVTVTDDFIDKQGCAVEYRQAMEDDRLSGLMSAVIDRRDSAGASDTGAIAGTLEIVNDDGSWIGTYQGADLPGAAPIRMLAITTGTGAYDGLSAMIFLDTTGDGNLFDLEAVILPSDLLVPGE